MKILYLNTQALFPTFQGNQRTGLNRILELSKRNEIVFVSFFETEIERNLTEEKLKPFCSKIILVKKSKFKSTFSLFLNVFNKTKPFQVAYYQSSAMRKELLKLSVEKFDLIHINILRMEQYANIFDMPILLDLHDSMILNISRRLNSENLIKQLFYRQELKRIANFELKRLKHYKSVMVLADKDKEVLGNPKNVEVIHLGVDTNAFRRTIPFENNFNILFSGNMNYTPNITAVEWFIDNCWYKIKDAVPKAKFRIVGADPNEKVLKYQNWEDIFVTGRVDSILAEIEKANVAIAPMQSGSGMQNKILEAMACEVPVVSTTLGLGNINAENNHEVLISDFSEDFVDSCKKILNNFDLAKEIGKSGNNLMVSSYSIQKHCIQLEKLYLKTIKKYEGI